MTTALFSRKAVVEEGVVFRPFSSNVMVTKNPAPIAIPLRMVERFMPRILLLNISAITANEIRNRIPRRVNGPMVPNATLLKRSDDPRSPSASTSSASADLLDIFTPDCFR